MRLPSYQTQTQRTVGRTVISNGALNVKEKNGAAFCYWQVGEMTHRRAALLQVREMHFITLPFTIHYPDIQCTNWWRNIILQVKRNMLHTDIVKIFTPRPDT